LPLATAGTGCERGADAMRWLLIFVLACLVFNGLRGWLRRIGLGGLPGDFTLRLRGREFYVPLGSSIVLTVLLALVGWML